MPQKNIFTRYPLLSLPHSYLSCGLIRTADERIEELYRKTMPYAEHPSVWEGAFRLAAMLRDDPIAEPVSERIIKRIGENGEGSFNGSFEEQIAVARAAMAVFEYNTDRSILRRIASWCRYLEVEWDQLFASGKTLFCPADLMELLVRFYQASGIKSVLRLCTKLRSTAFDWTTSLHTIQQVIPLQNDDPEQISFTERINTDEIEYDQKQVLMNHAEMLADGIRYSLFAGIFSGNKQDLSAGKTAWSYLKKHYRAICGGTTAGPFLNGAASDARVGTLALAAWTEAFGSQLLLSGSEWAADELVRIAFNGLACCLNTAKIPQYQYVNTVAEKEEPAGNAELYARMARAVASVYRYSLTVTETGVRVNCPMPAKYILMFQKQPLVLQSDGESIRFFCRNEMNIPVDLFRSATETATITVQNEGKAQCIYSGEDNGKDGQYIHTENIWHSQDSVSFLRNEGIITEATHHQGVCWFAGNRLMVFPCNEGNYQVAAAETPVPAEGKVTVSLCRIDGWPLKHDEPEDIPVLPGRYTGQETAELLPYDTVTKRISMFPRINPLCLK